MRLKKRRSAAVAVLTTFAVATTWPGAWTGAGAAGSASGTGGAGSVAPARLVRSILTHEFGVSRPTGVAWDAEREVFVVTGRDRAAGTLTARFTADEQARGDRVADVAAEAATVAFDPRSNRVTVLQNGSPVSLGD